MKKLLVHLESDAQASVFDQVMAYDAGADIVMPYGGVQLEEVTNLVYGAMFTRGGEELKNTAIFIGGTNVPTAEKLMQKVLKTFFGKTRVSVMFDANGSNTTAAACVYKIANGRNVRGKKALVLAGTGPVGIRTAILLAREGCEVYLSSRQLSRAEEVCMHMKENNGVLAIPCQIAGVADVPGILAKGVNIVACCGAPGAQLLDKQTWSTAPALEIIADINAVPPLGVEDMQVTDNAREINGKLLYGAIAIGNVKKKIHHASVRALFERNDLVLDFDSIYEIAKKIGK